MAAAHARAQELEGELGVANRTLETTRSHLVRSYPGAGMLNLGLRVQGAGVSGFHFVFIYACSGFRE